MIQDIFTAEGREYLSDGAKTINELVEDCLDRVTGDAYDKYGARHWQVDQCSHTMTVVIEDDLPYCYISVILICRQVP